MRATTDDGSLVLLCPACRSLDVTAPGDPAPTACRHCSAPLPDTGAPVDGSVVLARHSARCRDDAEDEALDRLDLWPGDLPDLVRAAAALLLAGDAVDCACRLRG